MSGFLLLSYMLAFALGSMTLALAIVYRLAHKERWASFFIVCHASLLGAMMLLALQTLTKLFITGLSGQVLSIIFKIVVLADAAFLIVFLPFFTTWVIAHPWRQPYITLFSFLAAIYLGLGVVNEVKPLLFFEQAQFVLFVFVIAFCLVVLVRNLGSIENKTARTSALTIIIVSLSMVPAIMLALFFPILKPFLYAFYFLALSITIMVFLFMVFVRLGREEKQHSRELKLSDLAVYNITEREFAIINLISQGLTNKEIASELEISANTVTNHVANIFSKTQVRSRIDLLNVLKQSLYQ